MLTQLVHTEVSLNYQLTDIYQQVCLHSLGEVRGRRHHGGDLLQPGRGGRRHGLDGNGRASLFDLGGRLFMTRVMSLLVFAVMIGKVWQHW